MRKHIIKALSLILAFAAVLSLIPTMALAAEPKAEGLGVAKRTVEEIRAFAAAHPATLNDPVTFKVKPSTSEPYAAGVLSDETNASALNMVNQLRYIAGLQSVTLDEGYSEKASAATLVLRFFSVLSHYFNRPEELKDAAYNELYRDASAGARSSNLGSGFKNLNQSIVNGWCADNGMGNGDKGHRRWLLNPKMEKTGFGFTGGYTAMYVFGRGGSGEEHDVAWPAQVTPVEYFSTSDSWSLSLGSWVEDLLYDRDDTSWIYDAEARHDYFTRANKLTKENVTVKLVRRTDNQTWNFSRAAADGVFHVSTEGYGDDSGCVIFWPKGLSAIQNGDVFDVTVTVRGDFGTREIQYSVSFFSLESPDIADTTTPTPSAVAVTVNGIAVAWTDAVPFIDANSRTMVPLRAVADAMGLDVNWDAATREASFSGSGKTIIFPIDSTAAHTSDGGTVQMDTAAVIVNERTYAPVRYLAEYFGYTVNWDAATRTVIITG